MCLFQAAARFTLGVHSSRGMCCCAGAPGGSGARAHHLPAHCRCGHICFPPYLLCSSNPVPCVLCNLRPVRALCLVPL